MKKLQLILALAIAFTMSTAAQIVPQGKMLPFNGVQKTKLLKSNRLAAPLRADGDVLVTPPETATIETNWVLTGTYTAIPKRSKWHLTVVMFTLRACMLHVLMLG